MSPVSRYTDIPSYLLPWPFSSLVRFTTHTYHYLPIKVLRSWLRARIGSTAWQRLIHFYSHDNTLVSATLWTSLPRFVFTFACPMFLKRETLGNSCARNTLEIILHLDLWNLNFELFIFWSKISRLLTLWSFILYAWIFWIISLDWRNDYITRYSTSILEFFSKLFESLKRYSHEREFFVKAVFINNNKKLL